MKQNHERRKARKKRERKREGTRKEYAHIKETYNMNWWRYWISIDWRWWYRIATRRSIGSRKRLADDRLLKSEKYRKSRIVT